MKKISLSFFIVVLILTGIFIFTGCEKEETTEKEQNTQLASIPGEDAAHPIVLLTFHKEGGHRFLGLFGKVRYNSVDKQKNPVIIDGTYYMKIHYTCLGKGNIECSTSVTDNAASPSENNFEITDSTHVYEGNINAIVDLLVQEIDEYTIERHVFTGSFSRSYSLPTIENGIVNVCFNVLWINGNDNGDADIQGNF